MSTLSESSRMYLIIEGGEVLRTIITMGQLEFGPRVPKFRDHLQHLDFLEVQKITKFNPTLARIINLNRKFPDYMSFLTMDTFQISSFLAYIIAFLWMFSQNQFHSFLGSVFPIIKWYLRVSIQWNSLKHLNFCYISAGGEELTALNVFFIFPQTSIVDCGLHAENNWQQTDKSRLD